MKTNRKVFFGLFAVLLVASTSLLAQVVVKDGKNKVEVDGKNVTVTSGNNSSGTINISGAGKANENYNGDGKAVMIAGSNHIIHITGVPTSITVSGSNNIVYTDAALAITTSGSNNQVRYARLVNNKKPAVTVNGTNNVVTQGK